MKKKNIKTAGGRTIWNKDNPTRKQFTKKQHANKKDVDAYDIALWNRELPNAKQYTKLEHRNAPYFSIYEAERWNDYLPNAEQYTNKEIKELKIIEENPEKITKEIFKEWRGFIIKKYKVDNYNHLMRRVKARNI